MMKSRALSRTLKPKTSIEINGYFKHVFVKFESYLRREFITEM